MFHVQLKRDRVRALQHYTSATSSTDRNRFSGILGASCNPSPCRSHLCAHHDCHERPNTEVVSRSRSDRLYTWISTVQAPSYARVLHERCDPHSEYTTYFSSTISRRYAGPSTTSSLLWSTGSGGFKFTVTLLETPGLVNPFSPEPSNSQQPAHCLVYP